MGKEAFIDSYFRILLEGSEKGFQTQEDIEHYKEQLISYLIQHEESTDANKAGRTHTIIHPDDTPAENKIAAPPSGLLADDSVYEKVKGADSLAGILRALRTTLKMPREASSENRQQSGSPAVQAEPKQVVTPSKMATPSKRMTPSKRVTPRKKVTPNKNIIKLSVKSGSAKKGTFSDCPGIFEGYLDSCTAYSFFFFFFSPSNSIGPA